MIKEDSKKIKYGICKYNNIGGYTCYKAISITKVTKKELQEYEVEKAKQSKNKNLKKWALVELHLHLN